MPISNGTLTTHVAQHERAGRAGVSGARPALAAGRHLANQPAATAILHGLARRTAPQTHRHGEELVRALLVLCKSDDERVRLGAITAALDRGWGKPAQAVAITGDPDSPVIFHLAMGDGLVPKVIDGEVVASEPLGKPLVAFSGSDDADSPV